MICIFAYKIMASVVVEPSAQAAAAMVSNSLGGDAMYSPLVRHQKRLPLQLGFAEE